MFAFLAPLLGRLIAKPLVTRAIGLPWLRILPVVAVLGFIGVREVQHWREVRGLTAIIATTERARASEEVRRLKAERAQAQAETIRADMERNRDGLKAELDKVSASVRRIETDSAAAVKDAELAAVRALHRERGRGFPMPSTADELNAAIAALQGDLR